MVSFYSDVGSFDLEVALPVTHVLMKFLPHLTYEPFSIFQALLYPSIVWPCHLDLLT